VEKEKVGADGWSGRGPGGRMRRRRRGDDGWAVDGQVVGEAERERMGLMDGPEDGRGADEAETDKAWG
jgi:hypothetical protein